MKIIFFGSSQFSVASLKALLGAGQNIPCVVTQPDRLKGRGLHLEGTPVKACAIASGLKIYQPPKINTQKAIKFLKEFDPDLFIVIAYGQILSEEVLSIPKIFAINSHASILPKYRGAAPINRVLICGEKTTGVTLMKMTEKMDAGPIIAKKEIEVTDEDTAITLAEKLSVLSAQMLIESLDIIEKKTCSLTPQDETRASLAPKLKKEDGLIDWGKGAKEIYNLVRGCIVWPGAFTYYKGKLLKIFKAKVIGVLGNQGIRQPGEIVAVSKEGIVVAAGRDDLVVEELQIEGKKRMGVEEFISGHKISVGDRLQGK